MRGVRSGPPRDRQMVKEYGPPRDEQAHQGRNRPVSSGLFLSPQTRGRPRSNLRSPKILPENIHPHAGPIPSQCPNAFRTGGTGCGRLARRVFRRRLGRKPRFPNHCPLLQLLPAEQLTRIRHRGPEPYGSPFWGGPVYGGPVAGCRGKRGRFRDRWRLQTTPRRYRYYGHSSHPVRY